ncbi:hypothetical protein ZWY2020_042999 [Hordeum vulgare]|nr:hypothetical protein ZWY2020_042999 [Hordeum vulgare]
MLGQPELVVKPEEVKWLRVGSVAEKFLCAVDHGISSFDRSLRPLGDRDFLWGHRTGHAGWQLSLTRPPGSLLPSSPSCSAAAVVCSSAPALKAGSHSLRRSLPWLLAGWLGGWIHGSAAQGLIASSYGGDAIDGFSLHLRAVRYDTLGLFLSFPAAAARA